MTQRTDPDLAERESGSSSSETNKTIPGGPPAILFVWLAVLIFATANAVVRVITDLGAQNPIDGRNAITFCNVLFAGNVCACVALYAVHRKDWRRETLAALDRADWIALVVLALLSSALAPSLMFLAIENTTVTNVVLVSRIEPPLILAMSILFLGDRPSVWTLVGAGITLIGVGVIVALQTQDSGLMVGKGELYAAAGAATLAVSTILSKLRLKRVPLGIFTVFRTGLGAIIFFVVAAYLYGIEHFVDVLSPFLWQWMLLYGVVIVMGGQLAWFTGIKGSSAGQVSLATSFSPVAGVAAAYLLLGEEPGMAVLVGGVVIVFGILVAQFGPKVVARRAASLEQRAIEQEGRVGFKGV